MQGFINEFIYLKKSEEDIVLDKLSNSDYFAAAAFIAIKEAEGPNIIPEIEYGRKDATIEEATPTNIDVNSNFKARLSALGFDENEIVALSAVHAFGKVWDPVKKSGSIYPKLDNYYFKQVLSKPCNSIPL